MLLKDNLRRGLDFALCALFGHKRKDGVEYPLLLHPIPREVAWCSRCSKRLYEQSHEDARIAAAKAFQVLMAEDDSD